MLNATLEHHVAKAHAPSHEISAFVYTSVYPVQCMGLFYILMNFASNINLVIIPLLHILQL